MELRDQYQTFDPQQYLQQYYSTPSLAEDDVVVFKQLLSKLRGQTFRDAIDVGCGPTIHHAFALAHHAERITLADFLPTNLAEVRRWIDEEPDAHNWDPLLAGILELAELDPCTLDRQKAEFRRKVVGIIPCDLQQFGSPLPGEHASFDLVTSFFCAECVTDQHEEWQRALGHLAGLVRPGGTLFVAAVRACRAYAVCGRWFPTTPVTEADFHSVLGRHGFDPDLIDAEAESVPVWAEEGFDSIVTVHARKS